MSYAKPLAGTTIVEIGHSVAAPFAGVVLAQLGAEVIKIESPGGGDHSRAWGPPFPSGVSASFLALNRDKKSACFDLTIARDRDDLKRLILERADVVIQNLRPGAVAKYGLDAKMLTCLAPTLIYCNINAFGHVGPLKDKPGYDPLMQAFAGMMSVTGEEGRPPVRVGVSIVDIGTGLWAVIGILAALFQRKHSGQGAIVDTSLYETALAWMAVHATTFLASGELPQRQGSALSQIVPYQVFDTKDGPLTVAAGNDNLYGRLCTVLGHQEWKDDPRFQSNAARVANRDVLIPLIAAELRRRTVSDWSEIFDAAGIPSAAIRDLSAITTCPQTLALGMLQESPIPGGLERMGVPISFGGERPSFDCEAPGLGEHSTAIRGKT
jgi:crotonobetainyl-CoA:carnitine CoA-transferase CaiB-like acyl-CoA transferase